MRHLTKLALASALLCLWAASARAVETDARRVEPAQAVVLQGRLVDDDGTPITSGKVTVNGDRSAPVIDGDYSVAVDRSSIYEIRYEGDQVYPFVHTYDDGEVTSVAGRLPVVALVARRPGRMLLAFGGDTMMGRRFYEPNPGEPQWIRPGHELEDGKALLRHIKDYLELADYASVNLESQLIAEKPTAKAEKAYTFYSHPDTLAALHWAGVDYVALGNNHTYDYLDAGLASTIAACEQSPVASSGAGATARQALAPSRTAVGGNNLSYLSYVGWKGRSTPSQTADGEEKGGAALGTKSNIVSTVEHEAADGRVVVVQYHGGEEYADAPTKLVQARLKAAIDHGADLVIGHHPHVLQGMEIYKGKLIAYSLGNFLFDQYRYETQCSALLFVWMDGHSFHRAEIVPLYIKNYHTTPATGEMRDYVIRRLARQSADFGLSLGVSGGHGVIAPQRLTEDGQPDRRQAREDLDMAGEPLSRLPVRWYERPLAIEPARQDITFRVGKDMLLWGDNEQHGLFGLMDSNWSFTSHGSGITDSLSHRGRYALKLAPATPSQASVAEQRYFFRVFDPDKPLSLVGYATSTGSAELSVCLDYWPQGMPRSQAIEQRPGHCSPKIHVTKDRWTPFAVEVTPPGKKVRGIRIRLQNNSPGSSSRASILIDDLALVAWDTAEEPHEQGDRFLPPDECNYISVGGDVPQDGVGYLRTIDLTQQTANDLP
jgi:poly-gamma-glutamate capsule biosynthesis protein CapA/YwtB (metallophosphatase superfamily)